MYIARLVAVTVGFAFAAMGFLATPTAHALEIYGAWHCGNDFCTWSTARTPTDFDQKNHWLIDRGDGRPSSEPAPAVTIPMPALTRY